MQNPTPRPYVIFRDHMEEQIETEHYCNGSFHLEQEVELVVEESFERRLSRISKCDGMECHAPRRDLRVLLGSPFAGPMGLSSLLTIDSKVEMSKRVKRLLAGTDELVGTEFMSWRQYHYGSGVKLCLGSVHVCIRSKLASQGRYSSKQDEHTVTASPCDGSCRKVLTLGPSLRKEIKVLKHIARLHRQLERMQNPGGW